MSTGEPATVVKTLPLLALVALFGLSSCDKVRYLVSHLGKKNAVATSSSKGSASAEIPKGVLNLLPADHGRIVLVDFYADWCGPCRMLSPILENVAAENRATVSVCKVNVDKFRDLATQQGVSGIPDVRIFVDGKQKDQFVGALPEAAVRKRIGDLVSGLPPAPKKPGEPVKSNPKEPAIQRDSKNRLPPGMQRL